MGTASPERALKVAKMVCPLKKELTKPKNEISQIKNSKKFLID